MRSSGPHQDARKLIAGREARLIAGRVKNLPAGGNPRAITTIMKKMAGTDVASADRSFRHYFVIVLDVSSHARPALIDSE
jgi:hypothetical protein